MDTIWPQIDVIYNINATVVSIDIEGVMYTPPIKFMLTFGRMTKGT